MALSDKIKEHIKARDAAFQAAHDDLQKTVGALNAEFETQQKALAQSFVEREAEAQRAAVKRQADAVAAMDAAVEAEVKAEAEASNNRKPQAK